MPPLGTFAPRYREAPQHQQSSAASIGKILGPSALVFVRTERCATQQYRRSEMEPQYDTKTNRNVPVYYARTQAFLKASIQTVDLATRRVFAARTLDYSPEKQAKAYNGYPSAPQEFDVLDAALKASATSCARAA